MNRLCSIIAFLTAVHCFGQTKTSGRDSIPLSGRNSVSFTGGTNITYPIVHSIPYTPWGGLGLLKASPWLSIAYGHSLRYTNHFSLGLKLGAGITQYDFSIPWEISYYENRVNEMELYTGIFTNIRISKKVGWHSELDAFWSSKMKCNSNWGNSIWSALPYGNYSNLFLLYQTGISFSLCKNFALTPILAFPIINFSALLDKVDTQSHIVVANAYSSLRTGITLSYNF